jgi:ABC-type nickel/cobalt efflux system permease component RcnA
MGRSQQRARLGRRQHIFALLAAAFGMLLVPTIAAAHPLGNYTINRYAEVRVEPDRVLLDVVIDQAEIPTFLARQNFDLDGDGEISDEETDAGRVDACRSIAASIELTAGGAALEPVTLEAGLSFPPGVGGLSTMRQTCAFMARLVSPIANSPTAISYVDRSFPERLGWREIVATGSGVTLVAVEGRLRETSVSQRLLSYPTDLIATPIADEQLVVDATLGGPALPAFDVPDAEPVPGAVIEASPSVPATPIASAAPPVAATPGVVPGGVSDAELPSIFRQADLTPLVLVLSLLTAAGLGAAHALTPGHGKTLMAAYLVGTRGTALHALGLGLSVSVSHTVGILVLAGVVVGLAGAVAPDVVVRWAPVVAAISIVLIGGWMLLNEVQRRRAARDSRADHDHEHAHDHGHANRAVHAHPAEPGHAHAHAHGGVAHSHAPAPGSSITWRSLFLLGLAGGLIPSTSALLILLGSIAAGRPLFGFILVVAFGLGMAAVMGGIGFALVAARDRVERIELGVLARIRETVPLVASVVVLSFGLYLTAQALGGLPTL